EDRIGVSVLEDDGAERLLPPPAERRIVRARRPRAHVGAHRGEARERLAVADRHVAARREPAEALRELRLRVVREHVAREAEGRVAVWSVARDAEVAAAEHGRP